MHNPPHPGSILKEDVIPAMGLTVTEAAKQIGVTRVALSRVLNGVLVHRIFVFACLIIAL